MADEKKVPAMPGVGDFLSTIQQSVQAQAATDMKLAETTAAESKIVADSMSVYNREAQLAKQRFDAVQAKGEDARRKAESGNIFDLIELRGDQLLDSRNYTAEGRSKQISEISQGLAMEGQIHNIAAATSEARVAEATAQRNLDTVQNSIGINMLRGQVEAFQLASQGLAAAESVKQGALLQFDLDTLNSTLMGPAGATGKYALNGIEYTPLELKERANNLKVRQELSMLSPQANDPDFAAKKSVQHTLQLGRMGLADLEALKNNGYMMEDGSQVMPAVWADAYNREQQLTDIKIRDQLTTNNIQNVIPEILNESNSLVKQTQKWSTPGSQLDSERRKFQMSMESLATLSANPEAHPKLKEAAVAEFGKAQQRYSAAIDSQALRRANGDKELGGLYAKQMRGESIGLDEVAGVMRTRYTKRQTLGDVLPTSMTDDVRRLADKNIAKIQMADSQAQFNMNAGPKKSDTMIREQAFNEAFDTIRAQQGNQIIEQIDKDLNKRTDNPAIKAGIPSLMLDNIKLQANQAAKAQLMKQAGITEEQFLYLMGGNSEAAKVTPEQHAIIAKQYNALEAQFTYDQLDKHKSGLGYEVQQWTAQESSKLVENYVMNMDPILAASIGDSAMAENRSRNDDRLNADKSAAERVQNEFTMLSTGAKKPENSWMLMLNMTEKLEDSQKAMLYYDVIQPALKQARANGMNDEVANEMAFQALNQFQSDDKVTMSAIKMLQRDLPNIVTRFEGQWEAAMTVNKWNPIWSPGNGTTFFGGGLESGAAAEQLKKAIPWARQTQPVNPAGGGW